MRGNAGSRRSPRLPGIEAGNVWSPEEVMRREARLGDAVIVLDEGGHWRGLGTAWALAEQGKTVTIVTPDPYIGKEITRTSADGPLRERLAQARACGSSPNMSCRAGTAMARPSAAS